MAISVLTAYSTLLEANAYVGTNSVWVGSTDQVKTDALLQARYYIDYTYENTFDQELPPAEVKYASALLAISFITNGDLFFKNESPLKRKLTQAGPVTTEKEFLYYVHKPDNIGYIDSILYPICKRKQSGTVTLIR